ncbi:ORC1-type DNA replication protein [Candidatus Woesearchaeota archaeon]|nr:ORC1-type DNA replication protein [Candidatus Woesearchaeota archaeon]
MKHGLRNYLENFMDKEPIFKDKMALQSNYTPEFISHRDEQIEQVASVLAPVLRLEKPSNLFIYGKTGTGKTLSVRYTTDEICQMAKEKNLPLKVVYLNCKLKKVVDTEYRIIAQLAREFGKDIPPTGLPTDEIYKIFYSAIDKERQFIVLILDEIDQLVKKIGDEVLYNLTRINADLHQSQITIIGISNNLLFTDHLDPRVKSSLSEEEILFPPYNAFQIQNILKQRVEVAFLPDTIEEGLIEKCAAYAARDHGDARRAIELIRVAAELAEREGSAKVNIKHLDMAEDKIEKDRIIDLVSTQPKQHQLVLYSIIHLANTKKESIITGEVYEIYKGLAGKMGFRPLTQRRVSDVVGEFDMLGLISVRVISKGRYGRTREINMSIVDQTKDKVLVILEEDLGLERTEG